MTDCTKHALNQPSIQFDDNVNLELPLPEVFQNQVNDGCIDDTSVGSAIIATTDRTVETNYFVTCIRLVVIEGGVYDYPFSTCSRK